MVTLEIKTRHFVVIKKHAKVEHAAEILSRKENKGLPKQNAEIQVNKRLKENKEMALSKHGNSHAERVHQP